ncbi:SpoIIE family protein phosphatase [Streptodolium elevatio]|uniref:SpoIIE family protein phosphatase n=1 Tax=Streptodolium elevatio TaxID=3157996 RepID=A0ABV3DTI9_9ACTN
MPFEVTGVELDLGSVLVLSSDGLVTGPDHGLERGMRGLLEQIERFDCAHRDLDQAGHDQLEAAADIPLDDDTLLMAAPTKAAAASSW